MAHRTLLIIEDDLHYAELLCAMMRMRRWEPIVAQRFSDAFAILASRKVDATILDLSLPDSDPVATLEKVQELKAKGAGSVVILTGYECTPNVKLLATVSGAAGVMSKDELRIEGALSRVTGL